VRFEFAAARPIVGFVVVMDVAEQEAEVGPVDDEAEVAVSAREPEVAVLGFIDAVELKTRLCRV
jgi:hypothetical protein